jgi:hypothetical protein
MNLRFLRPFSLFLTLCVIIPSSRGFGQSNAVADAEVQKCQDKIASVQRDILNHYDDALQELQFSFQKAADLEGALAVREERQRLAADNFLTEKNYVNEPKALHTLQAQTVAKIHELVTSLIQESLPRLIEIKKSLTMAGKLDEAVTVRSAMDQLQNSFSPAAHPDAGSVVATDVILQAYAADRPRADKTYKSQRVTVRGVLGGFRQDPADAKTYLLYLTGSSGNSWIQCAFPVGEYHFREEKQFNNTILVITSKDEPSGLRLQKGQAMDIRGTFDGWDEVVKMIKCDLGK